MSELLRIFVNILVPVFSLVAIGYVAGPRLGLDARTLSRTAYYILVPSFIFSVFSTADIKAEDALQMALYIVLVTLLGILLSLAAARALGATAQMTAAFVLIAAFGNVGNFGLPVIQFKLGDAALVPASIYFLVASQFGFIVGVIAATWHKGSGLAAVWSAFTTPGVIAVIPAVLFNYFDVPTPLFANRALTLLSGAMIPVMLVTLGVQLAGMGKLYFNRDVATTSILRLLAGPALAMVLAGLFTLSPIERGAGIIQASMPAAVLTSLIALEHDLLPDFVTTVVLFSTLASAITLTIVLALV